MSELISGKIISAQINEELRNEVEFLKDRGVEPCLAVILVGKTLLQQYMYATRKESAQNWESGQLDTTFQKLPTR
ncbi:MAG: hypothetical protein CM1200mP30_04480 [Pseudomonadota bacterium]|nr:MAG: hypothetical protein CM1200mP30_04480 [Pseudomonadota bacterium]